MKTEQNKNNLTDNGQRICLLGLLSFEVLLIAYLIISQAIRKLLFTKTTFLLTTWEFVPFINVALIQTCILIRPIAKYFFHDEE